MPENIDPQEAPAQIVSTTHIRASNPRTGRYEFSMMDLVFIKKFECITLFFPYDIQGQRLERALRLLLDEYFECFGRVTPDHETQVYQLTVTADACIPLIEQTSHLSALTALRQHGRQSVRVDALPAYFTLPFFLEGIYVQSALEGREELLKVKLTHYAGGECSVGFTIFNPIADLQRFYDMLTDLGTLMRGDVDRITPRDHDRTVFWPDAVVEHFDAHDRFLLASTKPRVYESDSDMFSFDARRFPNELVSSELLFFPNEVLDVTLARIHSVVEGVTVTRTQLVISLMWLLQCELTVENGLNLTQSFQKHTCWMVTDLLEKEQPFLAPVNFFGNALVPSSIQYKEVTQAFKDDVYMHSLTNVCLMVNEKWSEDQHPDRVAEKMLGVYDVLRNVNMMNTIPLFTKSLSWHFAGRGKNDCDFGEGPPCFMYVPLPYPVFHYTSCFFSDPSHNGTFATIIILEKHRPRILNSQVLQHCARGTRHIFENDAAPHIDPMPLW